MWEEKITDARFGRFLGGFVSEGTIDEIGNLKITNQDLKFIDCIVKSATELFGKEISTDKPPTPEHIKDITKWAFHKYLSRKFGRFLIKEVGIKGGKRMLNDEPLPNFISDWFKGGKDVLKFKDWIRSYIQARLSGDGWVHMEKKWVGLTKVNALSIKRNLEKELSNLYFKGKKTREYPKSLLEKLKFEAKKETNIPREMIQLKEIMSNIFGINSRVYSAGIGRIYYYKRRNRLIVSGIYHLIISPKENVLKFKNSIGFLDIDNRNIERLNQILKSDIAGTGSSRVEPFLNQ